MAAHCPLSFSTYPLAHTRLTCPTTQLDTAPTVRISFPFPPMALPRTPSHLPFSPPLPTRPLGSTPTTLTRCSLHRTPRPTTHYRLRMRTIPSPTTQPTRQLRTLPWRRLFRYRMAVLRATASTVPNRL